MIPQVTGESGTGGERTNVAENVKISDDERSRIERMRGQGNGRRKGLSGVIRQNRVTTHGSIVCSYIHVRS